MSVTDDLEPFKEQVRVEKFYRIKSGSAESMKEALDIGPVSAVINGDAFSFLYYGGGVIDNPKCKPKQNHAVLVVGYGFDLDTDQDYFIVKNSWGQWWGEKGYFRISADPKYDEKGGMCGILSQSYIAFVHLIDASNSVEELKYRLIQEQPDAFSIEEK